MVSLDPRNIDTIVVTSHDEEFNLIFENNSWEALAISKRILPKIKYFAIYRTTPISAVTHYVEIKSIVPCDDLYHKYTIHFKENSIKKLRIPIGKGDRTPGGPAGVFYTNIDRIFSASTIKELTNY